MTKAKVKTSSAGFTIIEVLIVLAIAALIILVVLLAVPALQRSQRNTGRRSDAGRVAAAILDFESNNGNNFPLTTADCLTLMGIADQANLSQYKGLGIGASQCIVSTTAPAAPPSLKFYVYSPTVPTSITTAVPTNNTSNSQMILATAATCNPTDSTKTNASATDTTKAALLYSVEAGSGWTWACLNVQ